MKRRGYRPWWEDALRGEHKGWFADSLRRVARLGSMGYKIGVQGRDLAYQHRLFAIRRLPLPTICVGNITTGGTGKTPLVIRLALDLLQRGLRPAVLLRGYKRKRVTARPVLVRDPEGVRAGVDDSGDEAMELARRLPGCYVGVGADRYQVGQFLLRQGKVDCFILDDGFQHHRLDRDINLVTLDVSDPWGGGQLLPAGLLREPPQSLKRADAVVLTRTGAVGPDRLSVLRAEVAQYLRPASSVMESRHEPESLISLAHGKPQALTLLRGRSILAVSAIGNPKAFEDSLTRLDATVEEAVYWPDHGGDPTEVWSWIRRHLRPDVWVVMTEKDAVRWGGADIPADLAPSCYALRMNLQITAGEDHWKRLLEFIERLHHD